MTSKQSQDTPDENPHTITYEGMDIHDVLLSTTTDIEMLQKLLDQGEHPCCQCFILAARTSSFALVKKLLELEPSRINTQDKDGKSLLSYFAKQPEDLLQLLKMGANPVVSDIENVLQSVICFSSENKDSEKVIEILNIVSRAGVQIDKINGKHILKLLKCKPRIFKHILDCGVKPNIPDIHSIMKTLLEYYESLANDPNYLVIYKEILSIVAAAGVELVDKKGCSLIKYLKSIDLVCHLLQLGASPFYKGENLIKFTLKNSCDLKKDLHLLIESGFDILEEDNCGCTFMCSAINISIANIKSEKNVQASCEFVHYVLYNPGIQDENFTLNCKPGYHPQEIIMKHCLRVHELRFIANLILCSKLKDTCRVNKTELCSDFQLVDMSLLSLALTYLDYYRDVEDIDFLCAHGFSVNDPGVSPLTVLLYCHKNKTTSVKWLLKRGVNVEQRLVAFWNKNLEDLKNRLKIPDALVMAVLRDTSLEIIKLLAPHAAFPPLALLLFSKFYCEEKKIQRFRFLSSLGRVPHGTQTYRAIREKVRQMANIQHDQHLPLLPVELDIPDQVGGIKSQELTIFDVAHRAPLSLLELSRYAVRMCLADTAAASNTQSLPRLFKSLLPPGLTDQHIAHKIEQVRNSEVKWLSNEEELLKNPPSLRFVECVP